VCQSINNLAITLFLSKAVTIQLYSIKGST
jgi:hypothetical protein